MSLPVGLDESLQRVDRGIAASEADLQGLYDLLVHDGEIPEAAIVRVKRKQGALGHLREDLRGLPELIEGKS